MLFSIKMKYKNIKIILTLILTWFFVLKILNEKINIKKEYKLTIKYKISLKL